MYPPDAAGRSQELQEPQDSQAADPEVEALRLDLIGYLASRFDVSNEVALARLGDSLLDPASVDLRQQYARANYLRRK